MRRALPALLLLASCGGDREEADTEPVRNEGKARPAAAARPPAPPAPPAAEAVPEREVETASAAADTLREYYALIGRGNYEAAWALRARPGDKAGLQRFIDNYQGYERYRATVGIPSRPVEAKGWLYVEVPVMIYGTFRGGRGFGNSGSVTLRKAAEGTPATVPERSWHIYTG